VCIKRDSRGTRFYILCLSEGREEKDRCHSREPRAAVEKDLGKLQARIEKGQLAEEKKFTRPSVAPGTLPAGGPLLRIGLPSEAKP